MFLYSTYSVEKIKCKHQEFFLKLCLSENKTLKSVRRFNELVLQCMQIRLEKQHQQKENLKQPT
jgi:hypothetical protein